MFVPGTEGAEYWPLGNYGQRRHFYGSFSLVQVPKIEFSAFKNGTGPGVPNAVVVDVIRWLDASEHFPFRGPQGMNEAAPAEKFRFAFRYTGFRELVTKEVAAIALENDSAFVAQGYDGFCRRDGR